MLSPSTYALPVMIFELFIALSFVGNGAEVSNHEIPRIGDRAHHRAGGDGQWTRQIYLSLFVSHAAGIVAIRRADAADRLIQSAESIVGTTQTGGARRWTKLCTRREKDLLQGPRSE